MNKSCGTCRLWQGEEIDQLRQCAFTPAALPFWASIDTGSDHADWTAAGDGRRCATYEPLQEVPA